MYKMCEFFSWCRRNCAVYLYKLQSQYAIFVIWSKWYKKTMEKIARLTHIIFFLNFILYTKFIVLFSFTFDTYTVCITHTRTQCVRSELQVKMIIVSSFDWNKIE